MQSLYGQSFPVVLDLEATDDGHLSGFVNFYGNVRPEGFPVGEKLFNFTNFDLPAALLNGLLTGAAGQINGTTCVGHNIGPVGVGTGVYSLGAPRQIEFGLRLVF